MTARSSRFWIAAVASATIFGWGGQQPLVAQAPPLPPPPQHSLTPTVPPPPQNPAQQPLATPPVPSATPQDPAANSDVEVLARGPVHEAFAEPVTLEREDPLVITKRPPAVVEELPPDQKPEGTNVQWVPGYWGWDDERMDFLWVSGVWRDIPPGQRWVPGYWSEKNGGWNWTSGFWVSDTTAELEYLPEPPESLEAGPQVAAPSADHVWVPGVWRYRETRYVWQPGYYTPARQDWIWVPARYAWCPNGWVYCDGYWDYPLARRGVLFAPVYYRAPIYAQVNYCYTPTVCIDPDILVVHLWSRPRYCHYYFGDYYGPVCRGRGFYPWFSGGFRRYDPLFCYYNWHHGRHDRQWHNNLRRCHDYFEKHHDHRPGHTFADLRRQGRKHGPKGDAHIENALAKQSDMAVSLDKFAGNGKGGPGRDGRGDGFRFAKMSDSERQDFAENGKRFQNAADRRGKFESAGLDSTGPKVASDQKGERRGDRQGRRSVSMENLLGKNEDLKVGPVNIDGGGIGRSGREFSRDKGKGDAVADTARDLKSDGGRRGRDSIGKSGEQAKAKGPNLGGSVSAGPTTTLPGSTEGSKEGRRGQRNETAGQLPGNLGDTGKAASIPRFENNDQSKSDTSKSFGGRHNSRSGANLSGDNVGNGPDMSGSVAEGQGIDAGNKQRLTRPDWQPNSRSFEGRSRRTSQAPDLNLRSDSNPATRSQLPGGLQSTLPDVSDTGPRNTYRGGSNSWKPGGNNSPFESGSGRANRFNSPNGSGMSRDGGATPQFTPRADSNLDLGGGSSSGRNLLPESSTFPSQRRSSSSSDFQGRSRFEGGRPSGNTIERMQPSYRPGSDSSFPTMKQHSSGGPSEFRSFDRGSSMPPMRTDGGRSMSGNSIPGGGTIQRFSRGSESQSVAPPQGRSFSGGGGDGGGGTSSFSGGGQSQMRSDAGRSGGHRHGGRRGND